MTQIQNIAVQMVETAGQDSPVEITLTFEVELSEWELEQNQPYYARAWLLESDGAYDEMVYLPNWHNRYFDTVPDEDADEVLAYLGYKQFRPTDGRAVQKLTFQEVLPVDVIRRARNEQGDGVGDSEEYYPFVVVEPEMHTVMKLGHPVKYDFDEVLL